MSALVKSRQPIWQLMGRLFRAHPWHGVKLGEKGSDVVTCYIEITPSDTVKYELDKATGLLKLDRPQRFSNFCPAPALRAIATRGRAPGGPHEPA